MSTTQQAALDAFETREETDAGDAPSEEPERRGSPYAARTIERIEANRNGEAAPQQREAIPPWRHDGLAPQEGGR